MNVSSKGAGCAAFADNTVIPTSHLHVLGRDVKPERREEGERREGRCRACIAREAEFEAVPALHLAPIWIPRRHLWRCRAYAPYLVESAKRYSAEYWICSTRATYS